jgi:TadE-like protein
MYNINVLETSPKVNQRGVVLVELAIVFPMLMLFAVGMIVYANYFNQSFWADQTAYNAAMISSDLESSLSLDEKTNKVKQVVTDLTNAHQENGINTFMDVIEVPDVIPYDPSNPSSDPDARTTSVAVKGITKNSIGTFHSYKAPVLVSGQNVSRSPFFESSGQSSEPQCCGEYGGTGTTPCIALDTARSTATGKFGKYQDCAPNSIGYIN